MVSSKLYKSSDGEGGKHCCLTVDRLFHNHFFYMLIIKLQCNIMQTCFREYRTT